MPKSAFGLLELNIADLIQISVFQPIKARISESLCIKFIKPALIGYNLNKKRDNDRW